MGAYSEHSKEKTELIIPKPDDKSVFVTAFQSAFIELPQKTEVMSYNSSNSITLPSTGDKVATSVTGGYPTATSFSVTAFAESQVASASATSTNNLQEEQSGGFWSGLWENITGAFNAIVDKVWDTVSNVLSYALKAVLGAVAAYIGVKIGMILFDAAGDGINFNFRDALAKINNIDVNKMIPEFFTKAIPSLASAIDDKTGNKISEKFKGSFAEKATDAMGKVGKGAVKVYNFDIINGSLQAVVLGGRTARGHKQQRDKRMREIVGRDYQKEKIDVQLKDPVRKEGTALDKYRDVVVKGLDVANFDIFSASDSMMQRIGGSIGGGGNFKNFAEVIRDIEGDKRASDKGSKKVSERIGAKKEQHKEISDTVKAVEDVTAPKGSGEGGAAGGAAGGVGNTAGSAGFPVDLSVIAKALYLKTNNAKEEWTKVLTAKENGDLYKNPKEMGMDIQGGNKEFQDRSTDEKVANMSSNEKIKTIENNVADFVLGIGSNPAEKEMFNEITDNQFSADDMDKIKDAYLDAAFANMGVEDQVEKTNETADREGDHTPSDNHEPNTDDGQDSGRDDTLNRIDERFGFEDSDGNQLMMGELVNLLEENSITIEEFLDDGGKIYDTFMDGYNEAITSSEDIESWELEIVLEEIEEYTENQIPVEVQELGSEATPLPLEVDQTMLDGVPDYEVVSQDVFDAVVDKLQEQYIEQFENDEMTDPLIEMLELIAMNAGILIDDISTIADIDYAIEEGSETSIGDNGSDNVEKSDSDTEEESDKNDEDEDRKHSHEK